MEDMGVRQGQEGSGVLGVAATADGHREPDAPRPISKVSIVGTGLVGSTIAYTLLVRGPRCELVLVDVNRAKAEGDAMDLNHGIPLAAPMPIRAADWDGLQGSDVVVIAAGVAQRPGETRLDLLRRNAAIITDVMGHVSRHAPNAIVLMVTNPVDVLAYIARSRTGWPASRMIGSGTLLDTMRLRYLLGEYFGCDPRSVHAYIIGEHGDSEIPVWSSANIGGVRIGELGTRYRREQVQQDLDDIFEQVRQAAYAIIQHKGATYYAIALAVARILESILHDQRSVLTISTYINGWQGIADVYLGMPCVVSRRGVDRMLDLPLAADELDALRRSAQALRGLAQEALTSGVPAPRG